MLNMGWLVVCETAIADAASNAISLINCLEEVESAQFPAVFPSLTIVAYLYGDGEGASAPKIKLQLVIRNPAGKELVLTEPTVGGDGRNQRIVCALRPLQLKNPGRYWFILYELGDAGKTERARIPVNVKLSSGARAK